MLIVMKKKATEEDLKGVKQYLTERDFDFHQSTGADRVILGVIGQTATIDRSELRRLSGVLEIFKIPDEE
jgi:hypothetical protein